MDFIIRKDTEFARTEFLRQGRVPFSEGFDASCATPEDIVLSKLDYYRKGGSEKHLADIAGMLRVSGKILDLPYLAHWTSRLGLEAEWEKSRRLAKRAEGPPGA